MNPKPQIKVCGHHSDHDVAVFDQFKDELDFAGFIFTSISRCYVTATQVRHWIDAYPHLQDQAVAVFLNQTQDQITQVLEQTSIQHVQLHGNESPALCRLLQEEWGVKVWKVVSIDYDLSDNGQNQTFLNMIKTYESVVDRFLLDTKVHKIVGGTGQLFDWSFISKVRNRVPTKPIFVAGGLNPDNVSELVRNHEFSGLDVNSGVETNGQKDEHKIRAFLEGAIVNV